jgi:transcriptional regulator with XRE-family HTH domain
MSAIVESDELGRRIRKLRMELRLTLKQVEEACGLSATHLSEIERGRTSPTIGALVRIARALHRDASYFIETEEREEVAHVKGSVGTTTLPGGAKAEILTPGIPGSRVFAYRVRLEDGEQRLTLPAMRSEDHAVYFVRSGRLTSRIGGAESILSAGDALQATLSIAHELYAPDGAAEFMMLTTRPISEKS